MIKSARRIDAEPITQLGQKTYVLSAFLFNIAQKPLFPIIEWIAGSVLKSPFFKDTAVSGRYRRVHFYLL